MDVVASVVFELDHDTSLTFSTLQWNHELESKRSRKDRVALQRSENIVLL